VVDKIYFCDKEHQTIRELLKKRIEQLTDDLDHTLNLLETFNEKELSERIKEIRTRNGIE
jgi:hypothetical protein